MYLYSSGVLADGSPEASMVLGFLVAGSHCRRKAGCGELPGPDGVGMSWGTNSMVKVADMIGYVDIGESKNWIIYDNLKIDIEFG